jgi:hypothetical protein
MAKKGITLKEISNELWRRNKWNLTILKITK